MKYTFIHIGWNDNDQIDENERYWSVKRDRETEEKD